MQPNETYSVPRRALDVEDYIDILRRHKGWIFGPFLFCIVASVVGVYLWPDTYVSRAVIKITPQQVPESMVQSSINQAMFDRIQSMEQTILSRSVLTTIINTYGLYQRERARTTIEDVIDEMKSKIDVAPVQQSGAAATNTRSVPAFVVQFKYENRFLAQRVVQDLVTRFIDENLRNRTNATFQTTQFMKDEFDAAKKEMDAVEGRLADFQMANNGRLPDQVDSNARQLTSLQSQATMLEAAVSRATQDRLQLESNMRIMKDNLAALLREPPPETASTVQRNEKLADAEREVTQWENALSVARQRFSENYPDVQTMVGRLETAKKKRDDIIKDDAAKKDEAKKEEAKKGDAPPVRAMTPQLVRESRDLDNRIRQMQSIIEAKDNEIQEYTRELRRAHEGAKGYQAKLEAMPMGQKQYGELTRDRDLARAKYTEMERKLTQAKISEEMETRKQGETLDLLDPASLPTTQTEPKRPLIISLGAGLGLLLGVVVAGAREMKDTSLKNLKDVRAYTQMSILGSIPLLENDFVMRRRKRLAWLGWTTACLAAAVVISGSIVFYYVNKQ
jgi:succinoglycan biosynthesis transport protein ExoP